MRTPSSRSPGSEIQQTEENEVGAEGSEQGASARIQPSRRWELKRQRAPGRMRGVVCPTVALPYNYMRYNYNYTHVSMW